MALIMDSLYYDRVRKKLLLMREKLHTFYQEVQDSEHILHETEQKLKDALLDVKEGNEQVQSLEEQIDDVDRNFESLCTRVAMAKKRYGETKRHYRVLEAERIHNEEYSSALERELIELSVLNTKMDFKLHVLMRDIEDEEDMCAEEEKRVSKLEKKVANLESTLKSISTISLLQIRQQQSMGRTEIKNLQIMELAEMVDEKNEMAEDMEMAAFDTIALLETKEKELKQAKENYYRLRKDVDFCIGGIL